MTRHFNGLTPTEETVLAELKKGGPTTAPSLAERLGRDREHIYKTLTGLCEAGIVRRRNGQRNRSREYGSIPFLFEVP